MYYELLSQDGVMDAVEADYGDTVELSQQDRSHLWRRITRSWLAPDAVWNNFVRADDDADIAKPCTDEGIVREVLALCGVQESDNEVDETVDPQPPTVSASTAINYTPSLKELVRSRVSTTSTCPP